MHKSARLFAASEHGVRRPQTLCTQLKYRVFMASEQMPDSEVAHFNHSKSMLRPAEMAVPSVTGALR